MAKQPPDPKKPDPGKKPPQEVNPPEDFLNVDETELIEDPTPQAPLKDLGRPKKPTMFQPSPGSIDPGSSEIEQEAIDFASIDEEAGVEEEVNLDADAFAIKDESGSSNAEVDEEFIPAPGKGDPIANVLDSSDSDIDTGEGPVDSLFGEDEKSALDSDSQSDSLSDFGAAIPESNETPAALENLTDSTPEVPAASEEAEAETSEEEKPAKKPARAGSRAPAWIGGTLLGMVLGGGALEGLNYYDVIPELKANPRPVTKPVTVTPPAALAVPALTAQDHLRNGDLDKAVKMGIDKAAGVEPAIAGQFALDSYLANQGKAGKPINKADPKFTEALTVLKKAEGTADGLFQLGRAQEIAGQFAEAKATFQQGEQKFKNDKRFKYGLLRLDSLQNESAPAAPSPEKSSRRFPAIGEQALGMILVTLLQQPQQTEPRDEQPAETKKEQPKGGQPKPEQPKPVQPKAEQPGEQQPAGQPKPTAEAAANEEEAGLPFWNALKLARTQNYPEAIKQLEEAKKLHAQRRLTQLRKQQNPLSDPNEEIFLRSCDELKQLWSLQDQLRGSGYLNLTDRKNPVEGMTALVKDLAATRLAAAEVANKLVEAKLIAKPEELSKGIDTLLADRDSDRTKLADLDKNLKTALKDATDTKVLLSDLQKKLDTVMKEDQDMLARAKKEIADRDDLLKRLQTDLVESKFVDPKGDAIALATGLKEALKVAAMKDPQGQLKELQKQVATLSEQRQNEAREARQVLDTTTKKLEDQRVQEVAQLKMANLKAIAQLNSQREQEQAALKKSLAIRKAPGELMPLWLPILQENTGPEQAKQAQADAASAIIDPGSTPAVKAQAGVINGLAMRNQDLFAQAEKPLSEALAALPAQDKTWRKAAESAIEDVKDPARYYENRFERLKKQGRNLAARQMLDRAIRALPESPALLTHRAALLLELAQGTDGSQLNQADPGLAQARDDADKAIALSKDNKQQLARAHYVAGRIAEANGELADALENYRAAVRSWPVFDKEGSRIRAALARVLNQPRSGRPPLPKDNRQKEAVEPAKIGRLPDLEKFRRLAADPARSAETKRLLMTLVSTTLQDPAQPEAGQPGQPGRPRQLPPPQGVQPGQPGNFGQAPPGDFGAPGQQPGDFPQPQGQQGQPWQLGPPQTEDRAESVRIANQLIDQHEQKPGSVPFDALAEAFAIKGMWSRALFIYVEGLRPHLSPEEYEGLVALLKNHPQLQRPDNLNGTNPAEAENRFAQGLRAYFTCNFADAEKAFRAATEADNQDARYFYFLGMTRSMLGKPEAAEDFQQGLRLERQNKPSSAAINASLERVQGDSRRLLNEARQGNP